MTTGDKLTLADIKHLAKLANLSLNSGEIAKLTQGFNEVLKIVAQLFELNTKDIEQTHQVTGLHNIFREDAVDSESMLTQEKALSNAKRTYNGYFVVDQILEE